MRGRVVSETPQKDEDAFSASAEKKQRNLKPFEPGFSGNPKGRVKGSRNRLSNAFISALSDHFDEFGADAIHRVWKDKPDAYLKVIGKVVPHKLETSVSVTNVFERYNLTNPVEFAAALEIARKMIYGEAPLEIEAEDSGVAHTGPEDTDNDD
jgi:hypothetical protein